jgi:hypothetical protein
MFRWRFSIRKQWKVFYPSSSNHGYRNILEEYEWLNVQNVEQMFPDPEKLGRWLDVQTEQAKECSLK